MRLFVMTAAGAALLSGVAAAETYPVSGVRIEDAAAEVHVLVEDRADIDIAMTPGARLGAPSVRVEEGRVIIDGDLRIQECSSAANGRDRVRIAGHGFISRADLPVITIRTPRTLDLSMGGAVFARVGASQGGRVALVGCGDADIGAVTGDLRVQLTGSGDATFAGVSGTLHAALTGSGDMRGGDVGEDAELRLTGSGDLRLGAVSGALDANLTGSGDLQTTNVGGGASLLLTGSGDVAVRDVRGPLTARVTGSGEVSADSVIGPSAELRTNSSGDVIVRGGRVERLAVRTGGSGEVRFGGVAQSADVEMRGSGDVSIAEAGNVARMIGNGSGSLRVGR